MTRFPVSASLKPSRRDRLSRGHHHKPPYLGELQCDSDFKMAQPQERECALCTNNFTTPKILPCGHLLCRECVISWMDSKPEAGCPLCRCPIVEQSGRSSSETVDALPTDLVMEALVESARVLSKDHLCCVCDDVKADFICMQCQDMLCSACTKAHKKLSVSRSHDVESLSTVTPERLAASRPALCADHGDKQADFFCGEHRLPVCPSCKSKKHKVCPNGNYLDDETESAQNSLMDTTKILVEAEEKLEQAIDQLTSRLQEVDVSEQEDMAQVDKACDRLQKLVEESREKLKENTRSSRLKLFISSHDVKTDLSNRLGKVTLHKHIVTRATAVSPRPALIHMRQTLTDRVNSLDLNADLKPNVLVKPLSSAECCKEVVGRIVKELVIWEQQKTESEVISTTGRTSFASGTQLSSTPLPSGFPGGSAQHASIPFAFGNFFPQSTIANRSIHFGQHSFEAVNRGFNFDASVGCGPKLNFVGEAPQGPPMFTAEDSSTVENSTLGKFIKRAHRRTRR